jgi:catechol 2,3-dioxygenase-like lactoylglutathione lyase family enzyme
MSLPIHHVALRVQDPEVSARFYGDLLGLPEVRRFEGNDGRVRSIWLRMGSSVLMLEREIKIEGAAGSGHVLALRVDALLPWESRLAAAGVEIVDRTPATLFFLDPDGHRVGLSVYDLG